MQNGTLQRAAGLLALTTWAGSAFAALDCADVARFLAGQALGVVCFHSEDLRTNNTVTTPPDNSITAFANGTTLPGLSYRGWAVRSRRPRTAASFPTGRRRACGARCRVSRSRLVCR